MWSSSATVRSNLPYAGETGQTSACFNLLNTSTRPTTTSTMEVGKYLIRYLLGWIWSMSFPILMFLLFIAFSMFTFTPFLPSLPVYGTNHNTAWWVMWKMYLSKYELVRELLGLKKEPKKPKTIRRRRPVVDQVYTIIPSLLTTRTLLSSLHHFAHTHHL